MQTYLSDRWGSQLGTFATADEENGARDKMRGGRARGIVLSYPSPALLHAPTEGGTASAEGSHGGGGAEREGVNGKHRRQSRAHAVAGSSGTVGGGDAIGGQEERRKF